MIKNKYIKILTQTLVCISIFMTCDYLIDREFRLLRNIILGLSIAAYFNFITSRSKK
jgi:hypothetical protein